MNDQIKIQESIFEAIKEKLHPGISLVDELAQCLGVSKDSAYRRLRGEKLLDILEVGQLVKSFNLSLDEIMSSDRTRVTFNIRPIDTEFFTFDKYLESILANLSLMTQIEKKELYYSARDLPIFHYFQFEELSAFKVFFWIKNYLSGEGSIGSEFSLPNIHPELQAMVRTGKKIWDAYFHIPCVEIWTNETTNITLRQIEFSYENGILSTEDAILLCEQYDLLLTHIKQEVHQKQKIKREDSNQRGSDYLLYVNEVAIGDNSILFEMEGQRIAFVTYNNINYLNSSDKNFSALLRNHFDHSIQKSMLISGTSEKFRNRFFNAQIKKINDLVLRLEQNQNSQI